MRFTFKSDDHMCISIPLGNLRKARDGHLMPEKFTCVFRDSYKVFLKGQPKALGSIQVMGGVFIVCLGLLDHYLYTFPSVLLILSGIMSYLAGHTPHMGLMKLSFSFNIASFFWAAAALTLCVLSIPKTTKPDEVGLISVVGGVLVFEMIIAILLIFWESKAVCRDHFNILPTITLSQE
ncbi:membrane-spanning 4-domains subfamily A member 4D isoform X2 [Denticeps clupeoides]|uniref:membrane-spanning 4-domains subfamily A member 4D isoform X2 n=1 Tax=Denticeps clupeoides TaxID=299321 RepID=UPI0010A2B5FA|nr:membrane-spanning 4-domains subfamily A member 4D-like isoform X2 [Denticeps clupeoides]